MTYIVVDVETDGPTPGLYSMISFGAVVLDESLEKTFYATLSPITPHWMPEFLKITGYTRQDTLAFEKAEHVLPFFNIWVRSNLASDARAIFVSDNNGFDFAFMNYYLWRFVGNNVFGHSSCNIADLYRGMRHDTSSSFKEFRGVQLDHNPVNDALSNARALLRMRELGLVLTL